MEELNKRKRVYDNLRAVSYFLLAIGIISFIIARVSPSGATIGIAVLFGAPGALLNMYAKNQLKAISNEFKSTFVKREVERLIPGSIYYPTYGISQGEVRNSHLIKLHEVFKSEDLIEGEIKDVRFKFSDVHVIDIQRSGKHTRRVTTFQGRFYVFDFNKRFRSDLFLLQPGQYRPFSGFTKIKMESVHFNSEFKIYAGNEHEAFYILTPHFMEKLLELDRIYYDKIGFSFQNNKLYIAIDSRTDSFDVMHVGNITGAHVNNAIVELERIIEFVEFLKLDNKMFIPINER